MLLFREEAPWEMAWSYKDHGKNRRSVESPASGNAFRWLHDSFGTNFRLTEMQAAIGLQQLGKLPQWLAARRRNAAILESALADLHNRSEEHTSELQSLMRNSYAVFCLIKKKMQRNS